MQDFIFNGQPSRVVFGLGAIGHLEREVEMLGTRRSLVLSTPEQAPQAHEIAARLGMLCIGVFSDAAMHVPIETVHKARQEVRRLNADGAIAFGGGSTIGLGKALALELGLPILAVPTTYSGSEVTPIWGITEAGFKRTGRDAKVLPRTVIYDSELTLTLPVKLSVTSAMNAIAHASEGLYAKDKNPITDLMAEEGIAALARAIPEMTRNPADLRARSDALYGSWLCGTVLGCVGMALHHKLCHVLGGTFQLPHAEVHAVILPHVMAFNASEAPDAMHRVARAIGVPSAAIGLFDLAHRNGASIALRELGMRERDLDQAADAVVRDPYWNPRPVGNTHRKEIRALLQNAYLGTCPA